VAFGMPGSLTEADLAWLVVVNYRPEWPRLPT
jgi:hypothetical protein